jgi:3-hydroxyisobutyrate dehydrogenase-like beta-hydroxyacid dehydrogenase
MNIGFVGLGLMGKPMALRLADAGHTMRVYNRTSRATEDFARRGIKVCRTPVDAARGADLVLTMVTDSEALRQVALGDEGILSGLEEGCVHVDCSTVDPGLTAELQDHYGSLGRFFLHAPVLAGPPQAAEGSLLMFVGGSQQAFLQVREVLAVLSKRQWWFPRAETATRTKIACNSFIAGTFLMLAQGMVFAARAGIGAETLLDILSQSALTSTTLQLKGTKILNRDFSPRFFVDNLLKDTNLMISSCAELGTPNELAVLARKVLEEASRSGWGKEDYCAAVKVWERIAGLEVRRETGSSPAQ